MTRIDRNMLVREALWILGHRDLSDVDALLRDTFKKAEKQDRLENLIIEQEHLLNDMNQKLEAVRTYLNELEDTGKFVDKQKIMDILEAEG